MHKEGVEVVDKEVYPDAPAPKELVDMEVSLCTYTNWLITRSSIKWALCRFEV